MELDLPEKIHTHWMLKRELEDLKSRGESIPAEFSCMILENEFVKPGKGQAFNRVKLRNLKTNRVSEKTFKSGDSLESADVFDCEMQYLYNDGDFWHFMVPDNFEQHTAGKSAVGDSAQWLKDGVTCIVTLWNGVPLQVTPPPHIELKIIETDPGLRGDTARQYIAAGISTDHECFTKEEALDKLKYGMKIIIREGSAAKNFEALIELLNEFPDMIMFCSDDKHPDSLVTSHINQLCARAATKGIDIFKILQAACINPVEHYKLDTGLLRPGDDADFILVEDIINFNVYQTYIRGELVAENGISKIATMKSSAINNFNCHVKEPLAFEIKYNGEKEIVVIEALDGQLITNKIFTSPEVKDEKIISSVEKDILKMAVVNRYNEAPAATAFIKNFGLKKGAIASSVAHDSHNIVAVGVDDKSISDAVNLVIKEKGGVSCVSDTESLVLPLPVAGLMSNEDGYSVAAAYTAIDKMAKEKLGSTLSAPFMTLSFMALLVIPHLKLSDKGLFDGDSFSFC